MPVRHAPIELLERRALYAADLAVSASLTSGAYEQGDGVPLTITVDNVGDANAASGFFVQAVLSDDKIFGDADDTSVYLNQVTGGPITPNEQPVTYGATFTMPLIGSGRIPAYLLVRVDSTSTVAEDSETNNTLDLTRWDTNFIGANNILPVVFDNSANDGSLSLGTDNTGSFNDTAVLRNGTQQAIIDTRDFAAAQIFLNGGDDSFTVADGFQSIYVDGGTGNDGIVDGDGSNTLLGGAGKDDLYGGSGDDRINGAGGNDKIYGQGGKDRLYGGLGNDYVDGGATFDRLFDEGGRDTLFGQGGNDAFYTVDGDVDILYGGSGTDRALIDLLDDDADEFNSIEATFTA